MKNIYALLTVLGSLLVTEIAQAQTPAQITYRLIREIKQARNLTPASKYIDWKGALEQFSPDERKQMNIDSSQELKKRQVNAYSKMGHDISESLDRAMQNASGQQKKRLQAMKQELDNSLNQQQQKSRELFDKTSYSVGKVIREEDSATVELIKEMDGKTTIAQVKFVREQGQWKLVSAAAFSPTSKGNSTKQIFGPSISSPDQAMTASF